MKCPKCGTEDVVIINNSHYMCNNRNCCDENGQRTEFYMEEDKKINFPYNQIFVNRNKKEFYRKPYLKISSAGLTEIK